MGQKLTCAATACALVLLIGCSTFELESGALCSNLEMAKDSSSETIHGSFWGFQWSDHTVAKCDSACGLYRVQYHTNAIYVMASVLSLGFYVPQTVEWWCAVEPRNDDDTEPWNPNGTSSRDGADNTHDSETAAKGR